VACCIVVSLERRLGLFFFKSYVASYGYVRRPGTDRIPGGGKKSYDGTGILIPVEKVPPERKKTGIQRIPAGNINLGLCVHCVVAHFLMIAPNSSLQDWHAFPFDKGVTISWPNEFVYISFFGWCSFFLFYGI
jgi:hypothetical protein